MAPSSLLDLIRPGPLRQVAICDDRRGLTFAELDRLARTEARWLAGSGGRRFGLLADNGCGWALSDLALAHLGVLNVPLPGHFTPSQLAHVLEDARIDGILTDAPQRVRELDSGFVPAGLSGQTGFTLLQRRVDRLRAPRLAPGTLKVTYTSGSTGEPKGVCLPGAALEAVARSLAHAAEPLAIRRHLCLLPLPTLLENVAGIYAPLCAGATCTIPSTASTGIACESVDVARLLATIDAVRPESLILVPQLLRVLVAAAAGGWTAPSLRFVAVGGAPVSRELLEEAQSLGLPVFQGYGLSECASVVCLNTPGANRLGSVGRPLPHAQVRRDARGELHVSGAVMSGYLGEPPCLAGEVATGDLGSIDADGFVYVEGRRRNVFITSFGRNVSPEWIERELVREPVIRRALAFGEARPYTVALLEPLHAGIARELLSAAVAAANRRLPDHARVRRWALLPEAPSVANAMLTANGRLRRERLVARCGALIDGLYAAEAPEHPDPERPQAIGST